jgi:TetR/AcrR family transcriptional repressor of nem operon
MARSVEFNEEIAIQKAMEVFRKKGYNGTSMRDLTEAMQINSSSLYNTIGDKQELFVRAMQCYTDMRKRDLDERAAAGGSALEILEKYVDYSVINIVSETEGCMAVKMAFEMATNDQRVNAILKKDSDNQYEFVRKHIALAMEQGELATEESPELLADYFIATWTGWNESYIIHRDADKIKRMARYFIRQLSK